MSRVDDALLLLRQLCLEFALTPRAVFRPAIHPQWPLVAKTEEQLESELKKRGHFVALPSEPAALANVIEVTIADFLISRLESKEGVVAARGTQRFYPDLELTGERFAGEFFAVDIKVARRASSGRRTKSKITLFTGNTYFRYPTLHWPGTFRPFGQYSAHIDVIALYDFVESELSRIANVELIVVESWRIGSRQRSSTTREYIGAVQMIERLRKGSGEFETAEDFYGFWRKFKFKVGAVVQQQLDRLLKARKD